MPANCSNSSTGYAPWDDISAGPHLGEPRGLWKPGSNDRPAKHEEVLRHLASRISPIGGKIGLVSMGMSGGKLVSDAFAPLLALEPHLHPALTFVNGCVNGRDCADLASVTNPYWSTELPSLLAGKLAANQVQAVMLFSGRQVPTPIFPASIPVVAAELAAAVQNVKLFYPNVQLLFFTSTTYGGYADLALSVPPEPHNLEQAAHHREMLLMQLGGSLACDPRAGSVVAPGLTWGPYTWCDGATQHPTTGLTWKCNAAPGQPTDVNKNDGHHPSSNFSGRGAHKLAEMWMEMFRSDHQITRGWFHEAPSSDVPGTPPLTGTLG